MTIEELYQQKLAGDKFDDMSPRMPDLRRYAEMVKTVVEFGVRTGNSTAAFLAGGASVHSYDIEMPDFRPPDDVAHRWSLSLADTTKLKAIPECDLLFIDTIHTEAQLAAELRFAPQVGRFILLHDVKEWGWKGENGHVGILPAIFNFLANTSHWEVRDLMDDDKWGLLVLERRPS